MIVTFYSYKGGVGRSMALANVADQFSRAGHRVLMVDFDLEAPGLEHFFPIDHDQIRDRPGLLDLLLAYKYSMSTAAGGEPFRDLDRFLATVYPERPGGGCLDLLHAGARRTDDQLARYGRELRRFDWLDFYFAWSGELLFEWLRREMTGRYDLVLVDSRTGVTEMGGVCAYQLADVIVVPCAPNQQNTRGTASMVRHFLSPDVLAVRAGRPLDLLVVPARVEQTDEDARRLFEATFERLFAGFRPPALSRSLWELQIPYDPRWAYDERVVTDPGRAEERRGLARAYGRLVEAIAELAPPGSPLAGGSRPVETAYDPTTRYAAPDVFLSYAADADEAAARLRAELAERGLTVTTSPSLTARIGVVLHSRGSATSASQVREVDSLLSAGRLIVPAGLPGAPAVVPWRTTGERDAIRLDEDADYARLAGQVVELLSATARARSELGAIEVNPFPGLHPFTVDTAAYFFGRERELEQLRTMLAEESVVVVSGPRRSGRTSMLAALAQYIGAEWRIHLARDLIIGTGGNWFPDDDRDMVVIADDFDRFSELGALGLGTWAPAAPDRMCIVAAATDGLQAPPGSGVVRVEPFTRDQIGDIVGRQARAAGLTLEPGLIGRLLDDVDRDGAVDIGVVQEVLRALWTDRRDGYLTHAAYERAGGLSGVLGSTWSAAVAGLPPDVLRMIVLELVTFTDRVVPRTGAHRSALVGDVMSRLSTAGLLVPDPGGEPGAERLVHPALLESGPVAGLIEGAAPALKAREDLERAAEAWRDNGRPKSRLRRGGELRDSLRAVGDLRLSPTARLFVERSRRAYRMRLAQPGALFLTLLISYLLAAAAEGSFRARVIDIGLFLGVGGLITVSAYRSLRADFTSRRDSSEGSGD